MRRKIDKIFSKILSKASGIYLHENGNAGIYVYALGPSPVTSGMFLSLLNLKQIIFRSLDDAED